MRASEEAKRQRHKDHYDLPLTHILPKANEIVNTSEQHLNTIYPFTLTPPQPSSYLHHQILSTHYEPKSTRSKFIPPYPVLNDHFKPQFIIYNKFVGSGTTKPTAMNIYSVDKLKSLSKNDFLLYVPKTDAFVSQQCPLEFDSRFQSGNLVVASFIDNLFCLLLHNDVNTTGYTNWFYFSVKNQTEKIRKERFAIMNYGKAGWPLNAYPGICVWSDQKKHWERRPCEINCEANQKIYSHCKDYENFNTLWIELELEPQEKIFLAYAPPYTYTDLLKTLDTIQEKKLPYFHRKLAGTSLVGNRLEMLTIANFQNFRRMQIEPPVIVILARTHAGQTVSSWIMHHLIKFLVSNAPEAVALRDSFIFKLFPMVNPDGVIHGNYRCSLIGRDLNRRWKNPSKQLYPEVYFIKNQIVDTHEKKQIKMIIDLHGHTQKRKAFFYGCADRIAPHKPRLFPYLASKLSTVFDFSSCNFAMEKSKQATARITLYNLIKIPEIFTLQTSQFGVSDKFLCSQVFEEIASTLMKGLTRFYKVARSPDQICQPAEELEQCQEELISNPALLKVGCQPSEGSDSEPSVCNLQFDRINKLAMYSQPRPSTEVSPRKKPLQRPQSSIKTAVSRKQPIFSRGQSREMSEKYSQKGVDNLRERGISPSLPSRGLSSASRKHPIKANRTLKLQYTRDMNSINKLHNYTSQYRPVRLINFQLLIEQTQFRKSSMRQTFDPSELRLRHSNYHMFHKGRGLPRPHYLNKNSV